MTECIKLFKSTSFAKALIILCDSSLFHFGEEKTADLGELNSALLQFKKLGQASIFVVDVNPKSNKFQQQGWVRSCHYMNATNQSTSKALQLIYLSLISVDIPENKALCLDGVKLLPQEKITRCDILVLSALQKL